MNAQPGSLSKITAVHLRRLQLLRWLSDEKWDKPIDLSAWDASHHSGDLRAMAKQGYVEIGGYQSWVRRVNKYRRTEKGTEFLEKYHNDA